VLVFAWGSLILGLQLSTSPQEAIIFGVCLS
jgi:hypothetical protein